MKKNNLLFLILLIAAFIGTNKSQAQIKCPTDLVHKNRLQTDAAYATQVNALKRNVYNYTSSHGAGPHELTERMRYYIPTVVHVIHQGEAIGTGTNVSDADIFNMISVLNDYFTFADDGTDMNIRIRLALRDPNGIATSGITRNDGSILPGYVSNGVKGYSQSGCGGINDTLVKNLSDWPNSDYFNIWIVNSICDGGAYATMPSGVGKRDGMVVRADSIGYRSLIMHAAGHWLGLYHPTEGAIGKTVAPNFDCLLDGDQVCDTYPEYSDECPGGFGWNFGVINNYMSLSASDAGCGVRDRYIFGQRDRVEAIMNSFPRNLLLKSMGCIPVTSNDAGITSITNPVELTYVTPCLTTPFTTAPQVTLKNYGTSTLTSSAIKFRIDNGNLQTYNWNGNLLPNSSISITLPSITINQGKHYFICYAKLPNGMADGYAGNDTSLVNVNIISPELLLKVATANPNCGGGNNGSATIIPTLSENTGNVLNSNINSGFEEKFHSWTMVNEDNTGQQPTIWYHGNSTSSTNGGRSIYTSTDEGITNNYSSSKSSVVHFYKDYYIPANVSSLSVKFKWKNGGNANDCIKAFLVPTSTIPVAGVELTNGQMGPAFFNSGANYISYDTILPVATFAGSTIRLVFSWKNNPGATLPGGSIDDINIGYVQNYQFSYLWSNGQTTQTATGLAQGNYTCSVTGTCGTLTKNVKITAAGTASITQTGPSSFCENDTVGNLLTAVSGNGFTYAWKKNGNFIPNETGQTYRAKTAGAYKVVVTTSGSCTATSDSKTISTKSLPSSTIVTTGPTTFCSGNSVTLLNSGERGNALKFDGIDDYVNAGNKTAFQITGNITLEAWINASSWPTNVYEGSIINKEDPSSNGMGYMLRVGNNGQLSFNLGSDNFNGFSEVYTSVPADFMDLNTWYHVAATYDGSQMLIYINGVPVNGFPKTGGIGNAATNLYIGSSQAYPSRLFNGMIDEVRIWNVARSESEIKANYLKTVSGGSTGLVAYFPLDEGNGTQLTNKVSNTYVGTLFNGTAWQVPSTAPFGPDSVSQNYYYYPSYFQSYLWSTGEYSPTIQVTKGGSYSLVMTGSNGCSKRSTDKNVTVNALPSATITPSGPLTFCAGGSVTLTANSGSGYTYKWQRNGTNISGANSISYTATTAGSYKVIVTTSSGCSKLSVNKTVTINCKSVAESAENMNPGIYPNPATDNLTVSFDSKDSKVQLMVFDVTGKVVLKKQVITMEGNYEDDLDISSFAPGVYVLKINTENNQSTARFLKQ